MGRDPPLETRGGFSWQTQPVLWEAVIPCQQLRRDKVANLSKVTLCQHQSIWAEIRKGLLVCEKGANSPSSLAWGSSRKVNSFQLRFQKWPDHFYSSLVRNIAAGMSRDSSLTGESQNTVCCPLQKTKDFCQHIHLTHLSVSHTGIRTHANIATLQYWDLGPSRHPSLEVYLSNILL